MKKHNYFSKRSSFWWKKQSAAGSWTRYKEKFVISRGATAEDAITWKKHIYKYNIQITLQLKIRRINNRYAKNIIILYNQILSYWI